MRRVGAGCAMLVWWWAATGCRGLEPTETAASPPVVRLSPASVSDPAGWALFDRSVRSAYTPGDAPLVVRFDRHERVVALKVRGPAPYRLRARSLGVEPLDLSQLAPGWHVAETGTIATIDAIALELERTGAAGSIAELEVWAEADPAATAVVTYPGPSERAEVAPGRCVELGVELAQPPSQLRRAELVYEATGLRRSFAVSRAINGHAPHGGHWMAGEPTPRRLDEQIDPATLKRGANAIRFCLDAAAATGATIDQLRIVGTLDRGVHLVERAAIGAAQRDGSAIVDGDPATEAAVAAGERIELAFARSIAPDALAVLGPSGGNVRVDCVGRSGQTTTLAAAPVEPLIRLDGGAAACATLAVAFDRDATVAELDVIGSGAGEPVDWPHLVVTSPAEHFGDRAWIAGFTARPPALTGAVRVDIAGRPTELLSGVFGRLVERTGDPAALWSVDIAARFADGTSAARTVVLDNDRRSELSASHAAPPSVPTPPPIDERFGAPGQQATARVSATSAMRLRLGSRIGADIPAGAVARSTTIAVGHLEASALPPLDPGMINVTAPKGRGYELRPLGQRFGKPVEVIVPFDPALIPAGQKPDEVHAYAYDATARRWRKLARRSIDLGDHVTRSAMDRAATTINAVLATPSHPTPLAFDPTTISGIAAASPATGIDLIEPPDASSTGDARVALPIRVPAGRGSFTPALAIAYSSAGGNGWLGVGWDLAISKIEIDTRWGVPTYAATEEPRYLLDGTELVPTTDVDGPTCPSGPGRRYHARVEGAFSHILRCGTDPSSYYFVVRDRDGTTFTYGSSTTGNPGNASLLSTKPWSGTCSPGPCPPGVARWHLRSVVDVDGNTTTFAYQVDDVAGAEPAREVYPQSIAYTSHPALPARYTVELILDNGARPDRLVSGRAGFKQLTRRLLRAIRVKLDTQVIRDYVLTYAHGQFDKTVLATARLYGAGGCAAALDAFAAPSCSGSLLGEHRFDYETEEAGFGQVQPWTVQGDPQPTLATLGRGNATTWSGGFTIGIEAGVASASVGVNGQIGHRFELVGMYDVDGNGLVDQLFDTGSATVVLYNQGPAQALFAPVGPAVSGLVELGREHHNGWGVDANAGISVGGFGASLSGGFSNSTSRAGRFLTDLDGDGFVDVVGSGGEYGQTMFSFPCPTGQCFAPGGFPATDAIDPTQDPMLQEFDDEISERLVLGDPVVQWVAPYSGQVNLLVQAWPIHIPTTGVQVHLTHQDTALGSWPVTGGPVSGTVAGLQVEAGEAIYLRVSTGADDGVANGALRDQVFALLNAAYVDACKDPSCTFTVPWSDAREPTGAPVFEHNSSQSLRINGVQPFRAPVKGVLDLHFLLDKRPTSAAVRYCVQRFATSATRTDYRCDDPASPAVKLVPTTTWLQGQQVLQGLPVPNVPVDVGDQIVVRAESDYSIDPMHVTLHKLGNAPFVAYTQACIPDDSGSCTITTDPAELAALAVDTAVLALFVAPVSPPEPAGAIPLPFRSPSGLGNLRWLIEPFPNPLAGNPNIEVAVRSDAQGTMQVFSCAATCMPPTPWFSTGPGESVSIEVRSDPLPLPAIHPTVTIKLDGVVPHPVPLIFRKRFAPPVSRDAVFVGGYRGLYATIWNERIAFQPTRLLDDLADPDALPAERKREIALSAFAPEPAQAGFAPHTTDPLWRGPGSAAFVGVSGRMHAARLGAIGPVPPGTIPTGDGGVFRNRYARLSGTRSFYVGAGVSGGAVLPQLSLSASLDGTVSRSTTRTTTDVLDMNGDGIADVVAADRVYAGTLTGATAAQLHGLDLGVGFRRRVGTDYTVALGSSASVPRTTAGGRHLQQTGSDHEGSLIGVSGSIGLAIGRSQTTQDLADVNGDGLPDLVQRDGAAINVRYNLGTTLGAWETIGALSGPMATTPIDRFASGVESISLFGNTLDSSSNALSHDTTLTQQVSRSTGFVVFKTTKTTRTTSSRTTRQLADLNGDGLPDLLFKRHGEAIVVQFNRGGDFGPPVSWETPGWSTAAGAIDLGPAFHVKFDPLLVAGEHLVTGLDVLAGTSSQSSTSQGGAFEIPIKFIKIGGHAAEANDTDTYELALLDVTGDGAPDHVLRRGQSNDPGMMYVKPNLQTGRANLLRRVHRPLGGTITLAYQSIGNTVAMPQRRHVLSRVEVDDGIDLGAAFASPNLVTTFAYSGGRYERSEKELFGFAKVTAFRGDGSRVERTYHTQTFALRGRLEREILRDTQNALFRDHSIEYEVRDVLGPGDVPIAAHAACVPKPRVGDSCKPRWPVVVRDDDVRAEGGTTTKTHTTDELFYDRFGSLAMSRDLGDDAIASDDTRTAVDHANDLTRWILGLPTEVVTRTAVTGDVLRTRSGVYTTTGKLERIEVDTGTGIAVTKLDYDAFGNLTSVQTPPNHAGEEQIYQIDFDPEVATYPVQITDGFGLTSSAQYDLRFGAATTETDTSGAQIVRTLDAFGRLTAVVGPYDTPSKPAITIDYQPSASPPRAITVTRASAPPDYNGPVPTPITTVVFSDGLGRAIELRKTATVDGVAGMTTSGFAKRDTLGREVTTYHPFFTAGASTAFATPIAAHPTTRVLDVLDRVTELQLPGGASESTIYAVAAAPSGALLFRAHHVDANSRVRETFADHLDRTRAFIEHPTATTSSVTSYDYRPTGELSQIVDAEGNITAIGYDLRGLRTTLDSADTGLIEERYDLMGNRILAIDPDHREVRSVYQRNRLVSIDYPSKPDVTYTYGEPSAPDFGAGRVIAVADESGEQQHAYGALDELRRTIRTVAPSSAGGDPLVFDTRYTTDSLGRQLELAYPDGEVVTNTYDAGGQLAQVTGAGAGWTRTYADQLRYDVFGNRTRLRLGNGVVTTWSYEPARVRLSSAVTTLPGTSSTKIQDLHYTYDPGSNPTQIANTLAPLAGGTNMPGASTLTLTYDGVDRLTRAVGQAELDAGATTTYDQKFDYSASHNLISKSRIHATPSGLPPATNFSSAYAYAGGRPHLPSQIGKLELIYDASGNPVLRRDVTTGFEQHLTWDDDHRLVEVTGNGSSQRNIYDASGLRVRRTSGTQDTVFASPFFDVENATSGTKHVFAGPLRVASSLSAFTSGPSPDAPAQPGTTYYFHSDHLGSTSVLTAQDGTVHQSLEYFADGESWIDRAPQTPVNGFLFSGKPFDTDTGFYDFGQRFYDPRTSLWLGLDPAFTESPSKAVARPMMLAALAYAAHSPIRHIDPDGRDVFGVPAFAGAGAGAGAGTAVYGGAVAGGAGAAALGTAAVVLAPGVLLIGIGIVAPQPPGYVTLKCGDFNAACWNDHIARVSANQHALSLAKSESYEARVRAETRRAVESEADEPWRGYEVYIHGTTEERARRFELSPEELFATTNPAIARAFALRRVEKDHQQRGGLRGKPGGVVIAIPKDVDAFLKRTKQLRIGFFDDMGHPVVQWVFQPGAHETLSKRAIVVPLPEGTL